ncbi:hypothetical protein [Mesorhizobium sp. f-mel]
MLKIGEALVSVIGEGNVPSEVEKVKVRAPSASSGRFQISSDGDSSNRHPCG